MEHFFTEIVQKLAAAGVESPRLETRMLFAAVKNCNPAEIFADTLLDEGQIRQVRQMVVQRLAHKPLDKILGHRAFYKADFTVDDNVLSPRPDTEILVEKALQYLPKNAQNILDLGTGSGCIIASIMLENPHLYGTAVDISSAALDTARENAERLDISARLEFIQDDWFAADFINHVGQTFDLIVSNPPYIPTADIEALAPEVKNFDPITALDGGADGFDSYRRIAELAPLLLNDAGYILLEAGIGQAGKIVEIFEQYGLNHIETAPDLSGISRCVVLEKKSVVAEENI